MKAAHETFDVGEQLSVSRAPFGRIFHQCLIDLGDGLLLSHPRREGSPATGLGSAPLRSVCHLASHLSAVKLCSACIISCRRGPGKS